jgi:hypothetical protein
LCGAAILVHPEEVRLARVTVLVWALALGSGCIGSCFENSTSPFPPGLEPLAENVAVRRPARPGDPFPEGVSIVTGTNEMYSWGHMRGFIHAPAADCWAAVHDPIVIADRRQTDEQVVTLGTEPEYEWSFEIHYVVHDLIDVDWDERFRFATIEGTPEAPKLGFVRSQKVRGLNVIHLIEGQIVVTPVDGQTCELAVIRHLDAYMAGEGDIRPYLEDMYASVRAQAKGEPLPTY